MKYIFLYAFLALSVAGSAQTTKKITKKKVATKAVSKRGDATSGMVKANANTVTLQSTSSSNAFSGAPTNRLTIADPVTNTLNANANGAGIDVGKSGIMGMPKRAFGFANGHLTLKPNSSTSTGTINGSGSVGTGSYPGSIGTGGTAPGVNGKNPYAGVDIWGTHLTGSGISIKESSTNRKQ